MSLEAHTWGLSRVSHRTLVTDGPAHADATQGTGVELYMLSTGLNYQHTSIAARIALGPDDSFDSTGEGLDDKHGPGTFVAALAMGDMYGLARRATVYNARVISSGSGSWAGVIAGIVWTGERTGAQRVAFLHFSGGFVQAVDDAVNAAADTGALMVCPVGNSNNDACGNSPVSARGCFTVAASSEKDRRASWSSYGQCVDVFAPGVFLRSAWIDGPDATREMSGTDVASGVVAGILAQIWSAHPEATATEVQNMALEQATPDVLGDVGEDTPNLLAYTCPL